MNSSLVLKSLATIKKVASAIRYAVVEFVEFDQELCTALLEDNPKSCLAGYLAIVAVWTYTFCGHGIPVVTSIMMAMLYALATSIVAGVALGLVFVIGILLLGWAVAD